MKVPAFVVSRFEQFQNLGLMATFFNFFQGRATAFAILFAGVGIRLAFMGKLDSNYALFVTAIQSLVVAHSWKEDIHDQRMAILEKKGIDSDGKANQSQR